MSLIFNTETLLKHVEKRGYKIARIYEGLSKPDEDQEFFDRINASSPGNLVEELTEFSELYKGKFCVIMRQHANGKENSECCVKWDTTIAPKSQAVETTTIMQGAPLDEAALRAKWEKEKEIDDKIAELNRMLEDKDDRIKEFETNGGKLAYVGLEILKAVGVIKTEAPVMQGTENVDFDPQRLKDSIKKVIHLVGGENDFIQIADNLTPEKVQMMKNFINS